MNELRRLVSQNSSVEEIRGIGSELKDDFSSHRTSLEALVKEVQGVVDQAGSSLKNLDKMEGLFKDLKDSSDKINTRVLDKTMENLRRQQDLLSNLISEHREQLDIRLEEIQGDMQLQNKNVGQLTHISLKDREKDQQIGEQRNLDWLNKFDSLVNHNTSLRDFVEVNIKGIEEKMKDIRSLLLAQTQMPRETEKWTDKLDRNEKRHMVLMSEGFGIINKKLDEAAKARSQALAAINTRIHEENLNLGNNTSELQLLQLDGVNMMLNNHLQKTQQSVVMSVFVVGIITPVVIYTISKFL